MHQFSAHHLELGMIDPVNATATRSMIEIEGFGGGTQNRTGVHGFADTPMIYNSIFFNE
jgi:hypothetical protein